MPQDNSQPRPVVGLSLTGPDGNEYDAALLVRADGLAAVASKMIEQGATAVEFAGGVMAIVVRPKERVVTPKLIIPGT